MLGLDYAAFCDVDVVDAVPHLLLGVTVMLLYCAILVQPTSVYVLGLCDRLLVCAFFYYFQSGFHLDS